MRALKSNRSFIVIIPILLKSGSEFASNAENDITLKALCNLFNLLICELYVKPYTDTYRPIRSHKAPFVISANSPKSVIL